MEVEPPSFSQGNTTTIRYDTLGRKISMDDPDMGHWAYSYDEVGNLLSQTDANGQTIEFTYDPLNRLTQKRNNAITQVTYIYDRYDDGSTQQVVGRLAKVVDQSGSTEFFYDKLGRENKTIKTIDGTSYTVRRRYDTLDRLISVTYPDGELVSYAYNPAGGVEKVVGSQIYVKDVDYNASGQMTHIEYGNGTSTDYEYDPKTLRLSKLSTLNSQQTKLQDLSYAFDKVGNVLSITDQVNSATQSFGYDDLNRLISAQGSYGSLSFGYDSIGNMTKKGNTTFTYGENGAGPHAVTSASGGLNLQMTYDVNGNMVQKGDQLLEYDPENRLIKGTQADQITTFTYDGDGGRVKKITPDGETIYIGSLYEIKSTVDSPQSTVKSIFLGQNRICQVEGDEVYYYHQDHIGSSNVITDKDGAQVALYEYKPYGENSKIDGSFSTDIRYTGKRLDSSTGLYYYGARYYDPEVGRFITADSTIQHPYDSQDLNRYSYCRNNPVRYIDPTGYGWFSKAWKKVKSFFEDNWKGILGGLVGGLAFGFLGYQVAGWMANAWITGAASFLQGAIITGTEFAIGGFGAGLVGGWAQTGSFRQGLRAGGWGALIGFGTGFLIGGSYAAGWQDALHGYDFKTQVEFENYKALASNPETLGGAAELKATLRGKYGMESLAEVDRVLTQNQFAKGGTLGRYTRDFSSRLKTRLFGANIVVNKGTAVTIDPLWDNLYWGQASKAVVAGRVMNYAYITEGLVNYTGTSITALSISYTTNSPLVRSFIESKIGVTYGIPRE